MRRRSLGFGETMLFRRTAPIPLTTALAALVALGILVATVLLTRRRLQEDLHSQLAVREARSVSSLFEGRLSALRSEGFDDPLLAAVEFAALPQMENLRGVTLYDAEGRFPSRLVGEEAVPPPMVTSGVPAVPGLPAAQFIPGNGIAGARLRVHFPLRDEVGAVGGILALELDASGLEQEYLRMDRALRRQGALTLVLSGLALAAALAVAFSGLARANRLLAERTRLLEQTNRELSLANRTGAVGAVASHLVHGLRSPLAGLQAFVAGLADNGTDSAGVADARDTARRMKVMIDEVVRVLRDDSGLLGHEVPVAELLPMLARGIPPACAARGVSLRIEGDSTRRLGNREANLLLLVLENLIANAAQASPDGAEVRVRLSGAADGSLEFRVVDSGSGIPDRLRADLFQPTISSRPDGAGIGLAITRRLALAMGAEVALESTGPDGSVFLLRIPPARVGRNAG